MPPSSSSALRIVSLFRILIPLSASLLLNAAFLTTLFVALSCGGALPIVIASSTSLQYPSCMHVAAILLNAAEN